MTEALLDYAVSDIRLTMDGAIDTMLEHVAVTCARRFGRADRHTREEVDSVAHLFDIDELCIVDRAGIVIASNDPDSLGVDMNKKEATQPFAALTNGTTKVVTQPFRSHAYSKSRRKYLGVPFPGGDGYVQVGMDEARMPKMINTQLSFLFDTEMGDTVCYLCADMETGSLVSTYLEGCETPTLEEIGFDASDVSDPNVTFEQTLFGDKAFCRSYVFGGHRFIMVVPSAEFYGTRDVLMVVMTILLALVLGAFVVLLLRISNDARRIKAFYAAEDAARAKDMVIAQTIQTSALPAPLAANPCFRLAASMTPAHEVGGDFYDFFMLDPTHLAFLVADVSGKGITAALYMMTAKTVIKDALLATRDIAAAFTDANKELCRNNSANMFLTAWGGVLNLETGDIAFVNAGHNPPVKIGGRRTAAAKAMAVGPGNGKRVEWLADKSGPVLACMDGVKYKPHLAHLVPGDALFLYTDGVTEAMDRNSELFGGERLAATLATAPSSSPDAVCDVVRVAVAAFADGAPAADDLTVLAVQFVRHSDRIVCSFPPTQEGISQASAYLDECLKEQPPDVQSSLHVILDEIASNIVKHSGASGFEVDVEFMEDPAGVRLVFADDGVPYDPLAHADPDTSLPAAERPIGGLGIMLVKKMADSISYERTRNRNFLTVLKNGPR